MRVSDIPVGAVRDVFAGFASLGDSGRSGVRVTVVIGPRAPHALVLALKDALVPETPYGLVHVEAPLKTGALVVNPDADLAIVCAGGRDDAAAYARAFSEAGLPVAIAVESGVDAPEGEELAGTSGVSLVAGSSAGILLDKLAEWMADVCPARVTLAASFPFCRRAVTQRLVAQRAAQNAAIGALPFGNGSDLPLMAANQVLMALDVASAYGEGASPARGAELAAVGASSLLARSVARLADRALPGLGWLARPVVAYGVTELLGRALVASHELSRTTGERGPLLGRGMASGKGP